MRSRRSILGIVTLALSGAVVLGPVAATSAQAASKHHKTTATTKPKKSSSSGTLFTTCPTATQISTAAGTTYPAPQTEKSAGSVICNYNTATSGANLVLSLSPASGGSVSSLKTVMQDQAKARGVTATAVSGFGTAAFVSTLKTAGVNGQNTSILFILDHSTFVDITADATVSSIEAVGHYVLSH